MRRRKEDAPRPPWRASRAVKDAYAAWKRERRCRGSAPDPAPEPPKACPEGTEGP